jgi:hypothetical protein
MIRALLVVASLLPPGAAYADNDINIEGVKDVGAGILYLGHAFEKNFDTMETGVWLAGIGVLFIGIASIIRAFRRPAKGTTS